MAGTTALAVTGAPSATSHGHSIPIQAIPRIRSISLTCCEKRMGLCASSMTRMSLASFCARCAYGFTKQPEPRLAQKDDKDMRVTDDAHRPMLFSQRVSGIKRIRGIAWRVIDCPAAGPE